MLREDLKALEIRERIVAKDHFFLLFDPYPTMLSMICSIILGGTPGKWDRCHA
jgi:hypothetical protein